MRSYASSKPPSTVNPGWLYWLSSDFEKISPDSNKIAALLFITRKKEICLLYKPTPIKIEGKFAGLIGNLFDEGSTPTIITIDADKVDPVLLSNISMESLRTFVPISPLISTWLRIQLGKMWRRTLPSSSSSPSSPSRLARKSNRLS